jgi:hypothetical protein
VPDHRTGSISIVLSPPAASIVTQYRASCRETQDVVTGVASPLTFAGAVLPRGRDLTFEVVALNRVGESPATVSFQPCQLGELVPASLPSLISANLAA